MPNAVLFCSGKLIILATGFCAAFRNASALTAAAGVCSVARRVPSGPIAVSCATNGAANKRKGASAPSATLLLMYHFMAVTRREGDINKSLAAICDPVHLFFRLHLSFNFPCDIFSLRGGLVPNEGTVEAHEDAVPAKIRERAKRKTILRAARLYSFFRRYVE